MHVFLLVLAHALDGFQRKSSAARVYHHRHHCTHQKKQARKAEQEVFLSFCDIIVCMYLVGQTHLVPRRIWAPGSFGPRVTWSV